MQHIWPGLFERSDSAIHRINRYPEVKYSGNQLRYPPFEQLVPGTYLEAFQNIRSTCFVKSENSNTWCANFF